MSFELKIGWRYLYQGTQSKATRVGLLIGFFIIAASVYLLLAGGGSSPSGMIGLVVGMIVTTLFGLLTFFSVVTTVSVLGVVKGVAALTMVLAVTTGFQEQFREKVLGVNAHVIIMKNSSDFTEYREIEDTAQRIDPDVRAVQPFIFVEMLVTRGKGEISGVAIKGVDPEKVTQVLDLQRHMTIGSVDSLKQEPAEGEPGPIILGRELARKLNAEVGDELTVVAPLSNVDIDTWTAKGDSPATRKFRISGIFYSGFDEYDRRLMYISLREAQELLGQGDQVMGIELKVADVERAREIADKLEHKLSTGQYAVQDWRELNRNLFTALLLQKIALFIILTLIILVATFNMVSSITMMVTSKTRAIAILKSTGATSGSIYFIFQIVGLAIGCAGTLVGVTIGLTMCGLMSEYGYRLDPKVYLIDRLPISVQPLEIALVAGITIVIALVATIFPSIKAAALNPVEGLRHE